MTKCRHALSAGVSGAIPARLGFHGRGGRICNVKTCLTCEGVTADDGVAPVCAHCGGPLLDTRSVHFPTRRGEEDLRSPLVGQVVDGKYRVVGVLGRGGMGIVYRAVHEVSLVHVALKVLHPRFAAREDFRAWFLGEARKAGSGAGWRLRSSGWGRQYVPASLHPHRRSSMDPPQSNTSS